LFREHGFCGVNQGLIPISIRESTRGSFLWFHLGLRLLKRS